MFLLIFLMRNDLRNPTLPLVFCRSNRTTRNLVFVYDVTIYVVTSYTTQFMLYVVEINFALWGQVLAYRFEIWHGGCKCLVI